MRRAAVIAFVGCVHGAARAPSSGEKKVTGSVSVPGATVRLTSAFGERTITADERGAFDFGLQPARTYVISAQASGHTGSAHAIDLRQPELEPIRFTLAPCVASASGTVRDASGNAIAGARVAHSIDGDRSDFDTTTGADGSYRLCVPTGSTVLRVSAPGFATIAIQQVVPSQRDIELPHEAIVEGLVVHNGKPVAGADVEIDTSADLRIRLPTHAHVLSDGEGRFRVSGLLRSNNRIVVTSDALAAAWMHIDASSRDVVSELAPAHAARGRVFEQGTSRPVAGAVVRIGDRDAVTQADGTFVVRGLLPGQYRPHIDGVEQTFEPFVVEGDADNLSFSMPARISVTGITTHEHQPVAGATIDVDGAPMTSDEHGRFTMRVAQGSHRFDAQTSRFYAHGTLEVAPGKEIEIDLNLAASIEGVVVDQTGALLGDVLVRCENEHHDLGTTITSRNGTFIAGAMEGGGTYECRVRAADSSSTYPSIDAQNRFAVADGTTAIKGAKLAVRVEHSKSESLGGRVVNAEGAGVADLELVASSSNDERTSAFTDATGRSTVKGLTAGTYALRTHSGRGHADLVGVEPGRNDLEIKLEGTGRIEGTLVGFDRAPRLYVSRWPPVGYEETAETASRESFEVTNLRPGTYHVSASSDRGASEMVTVKVTSREVTRLTLTAHPTGRIVGTVRDVVTHKPVRSAFCTGADNYAHSDLDGDFEFSNAAPGTSTIQCGLDPTKHPVTVVAGKITHLDVEITAPKSDVASN